MFKNLECEMNQDGTKYKLDAIHVGRHFKTYSALCKEIGIVPAQGNSRRAQMNDLKRYFDWEKGDGYSLTITTVHPKPNPKALRADDKYSNDLLTCLLWEAQESSSAADGTPARGIWTQTFTLAQLLRLCGFVNNRYETDTSLIEGQIDEFMSAERIGTKQECRYCFSELDCHIRNYCGNVLDRCLNRLKAKGFIEDWKFDYWIRRGSKSRKAYPHEEAKLKDISEKVKRELGISWLTYYNRQSYYSLFSRRAIEELNCDAVYKLREVAVDLDGASVTMEDFKAAQKRINMMSLERFEEYVGIDIEKRGKRLWDEVQDIGDSEVLETIELFGITADDLLKWNHPNLGDLYWLKANLVHWFISRED